jgi:uncharacterized membrane protein YhaH (DUF805 family)
VEHQPEIDPALASVRAGAFGNVLAIANAGTILLSGPPGSAIRPMGTAALVFAIALGTAFLTVPAAAIAIRRGHRVRLAVAGLLLGLCPLFLGLLAVGAFIELFNYTLKP